jgi:hypothetical protein
MVLAEDNFIGVFNEVPRRGFKNKFVGSDLRMELRQVKLGIKAVVIELNYST